MRAVTRILGGLFALAAAGIGLTWFFMDVDLPVTLERPAGEPGSLTLLWESSGIGLQLATLVLSIILFISVVATSEILGRDGNGS